jgi:hypothetical protein
MTGNEKMIWREVDAFSTQWWMILTGNDLRVS